MFRHRPAALAAVLIALVLALPAGALARTPAHRADGRLGEWRGTPGLISGHVQISRGELIYDDYLYDDYGPDLNGQSDAPAFRSQLARVAGDYRYPSDPKRYGHNAADLRQLRVSADARGLHALIALQTIKAKDAAVAILALDADGNVRTGTGRWPDGANMATPGADHFVTVWGTGGRITDARGRTHRVRQAVNLRENAIEVDIPWRLLGRVSRRHARMWIATGLDRPGGGGFAPRAPGRTGAFDLGFQGDEEYGLVKSQWSDQRQATALASGDLGRFAGKLDVLALRRHASKTYHVVPGHFYNRLFRSKFAYGEGINLKQNDSGSTAVDVAGRAEPMFLGHWQPYGLYIPRGYRAGRRTPLTINGHSLDVNLNEYKSVSPHQLVQFGDERGSLTITPLARGTDTWYLDAAMGDVFEAWADVKRFYRADPERTALTGYSMGGYLCYRLGLLMPDAFTRVSDYVGPPAYYQTPSPGPVQSTPYWLVRANTNLIVDNGLDLPFEINQGNADELVPVSGVVHQADTFRAAGNPYRFYHHQADDHLSFILTDKWDHSRDWLGTGRRNLSPTEVRFKRYPSMDLPRYGLRWDHAYWVDKVVVRNAKGVDAFGLVDATSLALGGHERKVVPEPTRLDLNAGGKSPAIVTGQGVGDGAPLPRENGFRATLRNVGSVLLRTRRMGLAPRQPMIATLTGDGPTSLRFDGAWPRRLVARLDGRPIPVRAVRGGGIAVPVALAAGGPHRLEIRRR